MLAKIIFVLFALIMLPFGIWQLYSGAHDVIDASQSTGWNTVPGQILTSTVKHSMSTGRHHGSSYTPQISYSYTVDGRAFTGNVITPGRNWGSQSSHDVVHQFPAGQRVEVHVAPTDPAHAILVSGLHACNFGKVLIGAFLTTFAALFGIVGASAIKTSGGPLKLRPYAPLRYVLPILIVAMILEFGAMLWLS